MLIDGRQIANIDMNDAARKIREIRKEPKTGVFFSLEQFLSFTEQIRMLMK